MKKFIVSSESSGKHVVKASQDVFKGLESKDLFHALKRKDIRVDGKKISSDIAVYEGQEVQIWLPDSLFEKEAKNEVSKILYRKVAETDGLLVVNKSQGVAVHSGKNTGDITLIDAVRKDLHMPDAELVHRIDMNTGGIVMIAKNKKYLEDAILLFKNNMVTKRYRALVIGVPKEGEPVVLKDESIMFEVSAFLEKTKSGEVYIHDTEHPGDLPITTRYRIIKTYKGVGPSGEDVSDIECELVTGRTHQIRAQFAYLGYPIVGDGVYGRGRINSGFKNLKGKKVKYQQLFASSLIYDKIPSDNLHSELSGRKFQIEPRFDVDLSGRY